MRVRAIVACFAVVAVAGLGGQPAAAQATTGTVDSSGDASDEHVVDMSSGGRLTALVEFDGDATLTVEIHDSEGNVVANDDAGGSPRIVTASLERGGYVIVVTAVSGVASYELTSSISTASDGWISAVSADGTATRSMSKSLSRPGTVSAQLITNPHGESPANGPSPQVQLRLLDGNGAVLSSADGTDRVVIDEIFVLTDNYTIEVEALSGTAVFEVTTKATADLSTSDHVDRAYERGEIQPEDAANYTLWAITDPSLVPEAYRPTDGTGDARPDELAFLEYWDDLDVDARQQLTTALTVVEHPATDAQHMTTRAAAAWTDCDNGVIREWLSIPARCQAAADIDNDGNVDFEILYNVSGPFAVPTSDAEQPRPRLVADVIDATTKAWRHYEELGFESISDKISIILSPATFDGAGLSLPTGVGSRVILVDTDIDPYYLPQHELFHQVQYEYIGVPNLLTERWWMEATAEWAAHQAQTVETDESLRTGAYASQLADFLGEPSHRLSRTSDVAGGAEYGAFILAEYLDERFGGASSILHTWEQARSGIAPATVIDGIFNDQGDGAAEELMRFRQWSYVLTGVLLDGSPNFGIGFTDPDVGSYWRTALQADPRTAGTDRTKARPHRSTVSLVPGMPHVRGGITLQPDGAAYIDLQLPGRSRQLDVAVDGDDVHASLLAFADYPRLCALPEPLPATANNRRSLTWVVPGNCTSATLVITNSSNSTPASYRWGAAVGVAPGDTYLFTDPMFDVLHIDENGTPDSFNSRFDRADVVQQAVTYTDERVELGMRMLSPWDPAELQIIGPDEQGRIWTEALSWLIDVDDDQREDYGVDVFPIGDGDLHASVFTPPTGPGDPVVEVCAATVDFDGTYQTLSFDASCIENPAAFNVFSYSSLFDAQGYGRTDGVPASGGMLQWNGPIARPDAAASSSFASERATRPDVRAQAHAEPSNAPSVPCTAVRQCPLSPWSSVERP